MNQPTIDLLIKSESALEKIDIILNYYLTKPGTIEQMVNEEKDLFEELLEDDASPENQKYAAEVCFFNRFSAILFDIFNSDEDDETSTKNIPECFPGLKNADLFEEGGFLIFKILDFEENEAKYNQIDDILFSKFGSDFLNHEEIKKIVETVLES